MGIKSLFEKSIGIRRLQQYEVTQTTLYKLLEAIIDEVRPEENKLVTEIVIHLIHTGRIRFLKNTKKADIIFH